MSATQLNPPNNQSQLSTDLVRAYLKEIAQKLNLSRERVRQLQNQALARLRSQHPLALREYLAR